MEDLGMIALFGDRYRGTRVLVTGHTGFKGSWLSLWLSRLGAVVDGVALGPPSTPDHYSRLEFPHGSRRQDIGELQGLLRAVTDARPEIVFHLAAQALVRTSYQTPLETLATNVMGTANLLHACRQTPSVRAVVVVTSDKCYENGGLPRGYREQDPLGGHDLYAASKACAEIVTSSYWRSFFAPALARGDSAALVASARAGNVYGGGDWGLDRLVPDLARACFGGVPAEIRHPEAIRPWQYVLDLLAGYLQLGQHLLDGDAGCARPFNFGPDEVAGLTVQQLIDALKPSWPELRYRIQRDVAAPHEEPMLRLDAAAARTQLGWRPVLSLREGLDDTATWYHSFYRDGEVRSVQQLDAYISRARERGAAWAQG